MPTWKWLPATERRIIKPALDRLPPELRPIVEDALETILENPEDPAITWRWWKGSERPISRVAIIERRVFVRYVVYKDFPFVGAINVLDMGAPPQPSSEGLE